jgi:hypothetical protein
MAASAGCRLPSARRRVALARESIALWKVGVGEGTPIKSFPYQKFSLTVMIYYILLL